MRRCLGGLSLVGKEGLCSWEADRWPIFKPLFGGKGCPDLNSESCFDSSIYRYADWFGCVALDLNSNYQDAQIHNAVEGLGMIKFGLWNKKRLAAGKLKGDPYPRKRVPKSESSSKLRSVVCRCVGGCGYFFS